MKLQHEQQLAYGLGNGCIGRRRAQFRFGDCCQASNEPVLGTVKICDYPFEGLGIRAVT